jgi:hypothetical protein
MPEATTLFHKILLEGEQFQQYEEYPANAAIMPGDLIEVMSTGKVKKNATAAVSCRKLFALEDTKIGRNIDTAYAADEIVPCHVAEPGHVINGWVAASASAIVKGDKLKSDGSGGVAKTGATTDFIVGIADEAVDNSSNGSARARLKIRIN